MAAQAKFQLVGVQEMYALRWAAEAISNVPCPADCIDGAIPEEEVDEGEWATSQCMWCAMKEYVRDAAGYNVEEGEKVEEEEEEEKVDYNTGTGPDWCNYCDHHWGNHVDHSWPDGGKIGCVLAGCDCDVCPPAIPQPCAHESIEACSCGTGPEIHELVADDMAQRHSIGVEEYGVSLRDCRIDTLQYAYDEALDLTLYLRRAILERDRVMGPDVSVRG